MSLFSFLLGEKKKTASVAKERLQIILAHERGGRSRAGPGSGQGDQRAVAGSGQGGAGSACASFAGKRSGSPDGW